MGTVTLIVSLIYGSWGAYLAYESNRLAKNQELIAVTQHREYLVHRQVQIVDLIISCNELENEIGVYRFNDRQKSDREVLLEYRVEWLGKVYGLLKDMKLIGNLIPEHNIPALWGNCVNNVGKAKLYYSIQSQRGFAVDSAETPANSFDSVVFNIIAFVDSTNPQLQIGFDNACAELVEFNRNRK